MLADIELPSLTTHMDIGEGDLDYAVDFDRVPPSTFTKDDRVNLEILGELRARSTARIKESEDFAKLLRNIRRYREQKERQTVTLNEEEFLKERAELDAEREEEKKLEEQLDYTDRPVVEKTYYFEEVLNLATDYLRQLQNQQFAKLN